VLISKLRTLSPRAAAAYAKKTAKTLSRDLNALQEMGLLGLTREGYRAKKEIILGFLPLRNRADEPKRE
jgi:predicted DNA-binding transcriptional regulator YafY